MDVALTIKGCNTPAIVWFFRRVTPIKSCEPYQYINFNYKTYVDSGRDAHN